MATAADLDPVQRLSSPAGFFTRGLAEADPAVAEAIRPSSAGSRHRSS